ncbi:MAG: YraN family protein [Thermincolia bacterium]
MTKERRLLGQRGEEEACNYLLLRGYELLVRNFRCKLGELDVVARDGETLVFIEVRSRGTDNFGMAEESVDWRKQQKLRRMAQYYMVNELQREADCRFDVVTVKYGKGNNVESIKLYQGAF